MANGIAMGNTVHTQPVKFIDYWVQTKSINLIKQILPKRYADDN